MKMTERELNLVSFETLRAELEDLHLWKCVVFFRQELVGIFESFEEGADFACKTYGRGPYLIKIIGEHFGSLCPCCGRPN